MAHIAHRFGLQQASERKLTVLELILLTMFVRTEFPLRQALEQRQLFSAVQARHESLIVSFRAMLKTERPPFEGLKYLVRNFFTVHLRAA